jgi:hypothetical protein
VTTEKKASISSHTHMNSDGTSQTGRSSLHGKHGTLPDFNTLRYVKCNFSYIHQIFYCSTKFIFAILLDEELDLFVCAMYHHNLIVSNSPH